MPKVTTRRTRKKPLTDNQRRAIARRQERRDVEKHLADLVQILEQNIPEGWRYNVVNALCCITRNGHLFAIAAGKAAALRDPQWGQLPGEFWTFVDANNAQFQQHEQTDTVARWNAPQYPALVESQP